MGGEGKAGVVLTCGVFDLFHAGHAAYLKRCAEFGDELVVAVMTDRWTSEFKKRQPVFNQDARASIVQMIKGVTRVIFMDTIDPTDAMVESGCRTFIHGNDWFLPGEDLNSRIPDRAKVHILNNGVDVVLIPYTPGVSTTELLKKMAVT